MKELIESLKAAEEPDRELDAVLWQVADNEKAFSLGWNDRKDQAPHFTSSIDAALTLVPSAHDWIVCYDAENKSYSAGVSDDVWDETFEDKRAQSKINPAIALCIAALRARQANGGEG